MLTLEEMSDRFEIQDLISSYSHAVDSGEWDALDDVFTADAVVDYTEMGGQRNESRDEVKTYLERVLPQFSSQHHLATTTSLTFSPDRTTAHGRTICHNPIVLERDGFRQVVLCGFWFRDVFVRTESGWRVQERVEERCYVLQPLPEAS